MRSRWMKRVAALCMLAMVLAMVIWVQSAFAADNVAPAPEQTQASQEIHLPLIWWLAPLGAVVALLSAYAFYKMVTLADPGDEHMQEIAKAVRQGAFAYLKRQYLVVGVVFICLVGLLCVQSFWAKAQHSLVPFAFLTGGFFSGLAGFFGMNTATLASNRTTQGATSSLNRALTVAFRAGAVMGLVVVGLGLVDICIWFLILTKLWGHVWTNALP